MWQIKAYTKTNQELINKLNTLAKSKTFFSLSSICFAPIQDNKYGFYDAKQNIIVLSDNLLKYNYEVIENVFLHELAHLIQYKREGNSFHDVSFKTICTTLGVDEDYKYSHIALEENERNVSKIKKLLALSSSPESKEAELALKKAQELMNKTMISEKCDTEIIYEALIKEGKINSYIINLCDMARLISKVYTVKAGAALYAYGSKDMIEVFTYMYDYFDYTVNREYLKAKSSADYLTGINGRNSFYRGVYISLKERLTPPLNQDESKALIKAEGQLVSSVKEIRYPNSYFSKSVHRTRRNTLGQSAGMSTGKKIPIHLGLKETKKSTRLLAKK